MKTVLSIILILLLLAIAAVLIVYSGRLRSIAGIQKLTSFDDGYNLYAMDVHYDYDLDNIISGEITDDQDYVDRMLREAFPLIKVNVKAPKFGCSSFSTQLADGSYAMGRNYDFKLDTSAMMVRTAPKDGYASIAFCPLTNLGANAATDSLKTRFMCIAAPFNIYDGLNEKGVSVSVLTLDSTPTHQDAGKTDLGTGMLIRLVLDRAATTEEAVALIRQYDNVAISGRDYHFYISDASGDGRVVEFDPESETRETVDTRVNAVTNFYAMYSDRVQPDQKNGIYGHGKERYLRIIDVLEKNKGNVTKDNAWEALQAASSAPNPEAITSNTQWSVLYNNTQLNAEISIRRNWAIKNSFTVR